MITLTINSVPQRLVTVDEKTIRDVELDGFDNVKVLFSSEQWLPVVESAEEVLRMIEDARKRFIKD